MSYTFINKYIHFYFLYFLQCLFCIGFILYLILIVKWKRVVGSDKTGLEGINTKAALQQKIACQQETIVQ